MSLVSLERRIAPGSRLEEKWVANYKPQKFSSSQEELAFFEDRLRQSTKKESVELYEGVLKNIKEEIARNKRFETLI